MRFPTDFLKGSFAPMERSILSHPRARVGTPRLPGPPPYSEADIKEALGYDRNDPNVTVQLIPFSRQSNAPEFGVEAIDRLFDDIFGKFDKVEPKQEAKAVPGFPGITEPYVPDDVTAPVTNAAPSESPEEPNQYQRQRDAVFQEVMDEVDRAIALHPRGMNSPHEGYAVIKEEFEELWDEIKADNGRHYSAREEAVQLAAMAIRYLLDINPGDDNGDGAHSAYEHHPV